MKGGMCTCTGDATRPLTWTLECVHGGLFLPRESHGTDTTHGNAQKSTPPHSRRGSLCKEVRVSFSDGEHSHTCNRFIFLVSPAGTSGLPATAPCKAAAVPWKERRNVQHRCSQKQTHSHTERGRHMHALVCVIASQHAWDVCAIHAMTRNANQAQTAI